MSSDAPSLAELTTLHVGGPAERLVRAATRDELVAAVRDADVAGDQVLILGGGSNIVVADAGIPGTVVQVCTSGMSVNAGTSPGRYILTAEAGTDWDDVVQLSLREGLSGLEALSGIPGRAGGTPIQNVGAYGVLTSDTLLDVVVLDRTTGEIVRMTNAELGFGRHRTSIFKRNPRFVVLEVRFELTRSPDSAPVRYAALADRLGVQQGTRASSAAVREAVLGLRTERGMVVDPSDHDTWSVGSFFLNPVVATVPEQARHAPQYPDDGGVKLPAAWLIEQSGFSKGYGAEWGRGSVRLSTKHTLAITNRGDATATEVLEFASHIRAGVRAAFGVELRPECDLVNCAIS